MPRTKKTTEVEENVEVSEVKKEEKKPTRKTSSTRKTTGNKKQDEKDAEIESLKQMVMQMQQSMLAMQNSTSTQKEEPSETPLTKYVKVINLFDGTLNIKTSSMGTFDLYTFEKFGSEQDIMFSDLRKIRTANDRFTREGYYYIADEKVVEEMGLKDIYKNILSKDQIEKFITEDVSNVVDVFSSIPKGQQQSVVDYLVNKLSNDENLDLNKIDSVSKIYGKDLREMAKDLKHARSQKGK